MGMDPELHPDVWRGVWKKFQMTNFVMPNNVSFMKYAPKSGTGLVDVGVLHSIEVLPLVRVKAGFLAS